MAVEDPIKSIRSKLPEETVDALSTILQYYLQHDKWMPVRALHNRYGGKKDAERYLTSAGGNVVFRRNNLDLQTYELTFLGVLIADEGGEFRKRIANYLQFAKAKAYEEPKRTHMHSEEVAPALELGRAELQRLGWLLRHGWLSNGGSFSDRDWNAGLPRIIEEVPEDPDQFLAEREAAKFDPSIPLDPVARQASMLPGYPKEAKPDFSFVDNSDLRDRVTLDWDEVLTAFGAGAWKSSIVLCGGILEAMLVDQLEGDGDEAYSSYSELYPGRSKRRIDSWSLADLVNVASHIDIIPQRSAHLSHALRHFRNLIHPTRHIDEDVEISRDSASVAINTIRIFAREFSERADQSA